MPQSTSTVLQFPRPAVRATDLAREGFHRVENGGAFRRMVADRYQTRAGADGLFWTLDPDGALWGWSPHGVIEGRWTWEDAMWHRRDLLIGATRIPDDIQTVHVDDDVTRVAFVERRGKGACRVYELTDR